MSPNVQSPPATNFQSPSLTIVLAVVLLVFFILGFFSVYFCRCFMESVLNSWNLQRTPSGNLVGPSDPVNRGLDPLLIKSFPTFAYSTIKDFRREKYGLECAICLVEFDDDSLLRLLTVCYHVFHQECIDLWLESHTTCPVCRRNLDSPAAEGSSPHNNDSLMEHVISINVTDNDNVDEEIIRQRQSVDGGEDEEPSRLRPPSSHGMAVDKSESENRPEKFSRSHSTGHSIVRTSRNDKDREVEEEDKYTLRVPEQVKLKLLRGHHWTKSCTTYGELCRHNPNGGFGEVSGSCSCAAGDIAIN